MRRSTCKKPTHGKVAESEGRKINSSWEGSGCQVSRGHVSNLRSGPSNPATSVVKADFNKRVLSFIYIPSWVCPSFKNGQRKGVESGRLVPRYNHGHVSIIASCARKLEDACQDANRARGIGFVVDQRRGSGYR